MSPKLLIQLLGSEFKRTVGHIIAIDFIALFHVNRAETAHITAVCRDIQLSFRPILATFTLSPKVKFLLIVLENMFLVESRR